MKTSSWSSDFLPYGAYIDELRFVIFKEGEVPQAMLALQKGDIDAYDDRVPNDYLAALVRDPDIEVRFTPDLRYRVITPNCGRFPTNITGYRRAMAFGMDKYRANIEAVGGAGQPMDSYIPTAATEWEIESQLTEYFYEADSISGNLSLENAGFIDLDSDGWREYDVNDNRIYDSSVDIDDQDCEIEFSYSEGYSPARITCEIAAEGLQSMGMRATLVPSYPVSGNWFNAFQVGCWTEGTPVVNTAKILYNRFHSSGKDWDYYCFRNTTIETILDKMVNSNSVEDIKKYAHEVNKLLVYEQPQIVAYNVVFTNAYRTDKFEGFASFNGRGISDGNNPYFATKIHLIESKGGPYGGTFKYCLSADLSTRNCYLQQSKYDFTVFQYIYEKLWNVDPNTWAPIPGLAYDWDIETTIENVAAGTQNGQKFTFYLPENASWHDGQPITSLDVKHSFDLAKQCLWSPQELNDIYNVKIPNNYTIEFFVNKTGYFEWGDVTNFPYIVPWHIWQDVTDVMTFNPTDEQMIGSGPYKWDEYITGEYISLLRFKDWHWGILDVPITTSEDLSTTPMNMTQTSKTTSTSIASTSGFSFIVFIACFGIILIKRSEKNRERNK